MQPDGRKEEVYRQLGGVYDPELDLPITDLGFISGVEVDGGTVRVLFRLPTFWCAANFVYMMAADIREQVSQLPWVERVEVHLRDHFFESEINRAVNAGLSFREALPDLATGDLDDLRATFRVKAFLRRQAELVRWLLRKGWDGEAVRTVRVGQLEALVKDDPAAAELVRRFLQALRERGADVSPDAPVLVDAEGKPISPERFEGYLRDAARVQTAMEFNASLCRGLLQSRYGDSCAETAGRYENVTARNGERERSLA